MHLRNAIKAALIATCSVALAAGAYANSVKIKYSSEFPAPYMYSLQIEFSHDGERWTADMYDENVDGDLDHFVQRGSSVRRDGSLQFIKEGLMLYGDNAFYVFDYAENNGTLDISMSTLDAGEFEKYQLAFDDAVQHLPENDLYRRMTGK